MDVHFGSITVRDLMADYAALLNTYGPESQEAEDYLLANSADEEFVSLAKLAKTLKKTILADLAK